MEPLHQSDQFAGKDHSEQGIENFSHGDIAQRQRENEKIKEKVPGKLWLRNNVSTMICNSIENYLFSFLAFAGLMDITTILSIATLASVLEIVIAACDTPFLYLSKKLK